MRAAFNIPASWDIVTLMPMGYAGDEAHPSKWHFVRKRPEELYTFI